MAIPFLTTKKKIKSKGVKWLNHFIDVVQYPYVILLWYFFFKK